MTSPEQDVLFGLWTEDILYVSHRRFVLSRAATGKMCYSLWFRQLDPALEVPRDVAIVSTWDNVPAQGETMNAMKKAIDACLGDLAIGADNITYVGHLPEHAARYMLGDPLLPFYEKLAVKNGTLHNSLV